MSILQHIWWCTDTQINLGLSDVARQRHAEVAQKRGPKSFNSSFSSNHEMLSSSVSAQRKPSGRVSKLRDAVASTSGGRLLAQYFGQQPQDGKENRGQELGSSSNFCRGTAFYAEYLALPTCCSTGDFEAQVFFLMVGRPFASSSVHSTLIYRKPWDISWPFSLSWSFRCPRDGNMSSKLSNAVITSTDSTTKDCLVRAQHSRKVSISSYCFKFLAVKGSSSYFFVLSCCSVSFRHLRILVVLVLSFAFRFCACMCKNLQTCSAWCRSNASVVGSRHTFCTGPS